MFAEKYICMGLSRAQQSPIHYFSRVKLHFPVKTHRRGGWTAPLAKTGGDGQEVLALLRPIGSLRGQTVLFDLERRQRAGMGYELTGIWTHIFHPWNKSVRQD